MHLGLEIAAFVLFVLACLPVGERFNLVAAGLACLTLTLII